MSATADTSPLGRAAAAVEGLAALDGVAQAVAGAVRGLVPHGPVKDALSGTWLGHALHPLLRIAEACGANRRSDWGTR